MRKCLSAPNLVELGATGSIVKSGSLPNLQTKARNVCTKAVSVLDTISTISTVYQVDSMINAPISQHIKCAFTHQFPSDLLSDPSNANTQDNDTKDLALCEAEPNDTNSENRLPRYAPRNRLFLSRCADDMELTERYAMHLLRQRKLKFTKQ